MATAEIAHAKKRAPEKLPPEGKKKTRAFRWKRWLFLIALVGLAYLAPAIVANTPLGLWIVQSAVPINGSIVWDSVSLGWFSTVAVEKLKVSDAEGQSIVEVDSITSEKPLMAMLLDLGDLGVLHIEHPSVHVVAQESETNLEQSLGPLLEGSGNRITAELKLTGGTVVVDDVPSGRQYRIEELAIDAAIDNPANIVLAISGTLANDRQPGSFKVDIQLTGTSDAPLAGGKIDCQASAIPLDMLQPLVRRRIEHTSVAGQLSARLSGAWGQSGEANSTSVQGEGLVTGLIVSNPALGDQPVQLDRVELPCHLVQNGETIEIEQLAVSCDLGSLSLSGSVKASDLASDHLLSTLAHESYAVNGQVDLARVARMFEHVLAVRQGTEITSGQAVLTLTSRQQPDGMTWSGHIEATDLAGQAEGKPLAWNHPLSIEFATHETADGIVVDQAQCTSDFLQVDASGSIADLKASADFDIGKLVTQLRQFFDLDGLQLAGQGRGQLTWKRVDASGFTASGEFQAAGFQYVMPDGRAWTEDKLVARLDANGQLDHNTIKRIESAQLTLDSGNERMEVRLQEAIDEPLTAAWPLTCSWSGQLAHWAPRLESCLGVAGWDLAGVGTMQLALNCSPKTIAIDQAKADFTQFQAHGHGWFVNEPAISATFEGHLDVTARRIDVAEAKFSAGAAAATTTQVVLARRGTLWSLESASTEFEGDLAQCYAWRNDPRTPPTWNVAGRLSGRAEVKLDQGDASAQVDATIDNLRLAALAARAPGATPVTCQQNQVTLAIIGKCQTDGGQFQFDKLQVASDMLRCDAQGSVALTADGGEVDLKGTVQYDWEHLAPFWQPYLGNEVQVSGNETRAFSLHGPWTGDPTQIQSWREITADAAIGWAGMSVYGLQVAQGEIAAQLADGELRTHAIDIAVNEGRLTVAPQVHLTPLPSQLLLSGGPLLTDVHLSPELCAQGVRFVAPILAQATVADGRFSMTLDGGWIPILNPAAGDVSGRMAIRAQAKPGPIAEQFMVLLNELTTVLRKGVITGVDEQTGAVLSIDDSNVEFRMVGGRVYHRGLQFMAGTVPVTTYGSVGLDESVAIMAEIPLKATLFGRDLSFGTLEGQVVQIPIGGTLAAPKLDRVALAQLTGKMIQNTARGVLIDGVGKTLERLLPVQPANP